MKNSRRKGMTDADGLGNDGDVTIDALEIEPPAQSERQLNLEFARRFAGVVQNSGKNIQKRLVRSLMFSLVDKQNPRGLTKVAKSR